MPILRQTVPVAITALALTLAGCASASRGGSTKGIEREWAVKLQLQELSTVDVAPDGGHVLVAPRLSERNLNVLNGQSGARVWREREGLRRQLLSNTEVGSLRGADFEPSSYQYVPLPASRIVLISDYTATTDVIRARDLASGKELWQIRDHPWTPKVQQAIVGAVANKLVLSLLRSGATDAARVAAVVGDAATQSAHISDLIQPLPSGDGVLLKHLGGLACFDLRTGTKRWNIAEFTGGGLRHVAQLPDGDIVVTAGVVATLADIAAPHRIARIDPVSGDVRWLSTFAVDGWADADYDLPTLVEAHGNRLIVHRVHTQVFDLETGAVLYRHAAYPSLEGKHRLAVADGILYALVNPLLEQPPVFDVYTGPLPTYLRAIDLADGRVLWESERTNSNVHSITIAGDRLLVAASGELAPGGHGIVALNRGDGRILWKSPTFDQPPVLRRVSLAERVAPVWVSNMIVSDSVIHAASATTLYALRVEDGSAKTTVNHRGQDLGMVHRIHDAGAQVMVIGTDGLALYGKADGALGFRTPRGRVSDYSLAGAHVFLRRGNQLTIVRPAAGRVVAQVRLQPPSGSVFGNVSRGAFVPEDGQSLFVLDKNHMLARFRLPK
jgi:outer membrane protein assembly factor BamB